MGCELVRLLLFSLFITYKAIEKDLKALHILVYSVLGQMVYRIMPTQYKVLN